MGPHQQFNRKLLAMEMELMRKSDFSQKVESVAMLSPILNFQRCRYSRILLRAFIPKNVPLAQILILSSRTVIVSKLNTYKFVV